MTDKVLKSIIDALNRHLKVRWSVGQREDKVVLTCLVNQDGSVPPDNANKIICSIVNFEQEKVHSYGSFTTAGNGLKNPPVNLDLYLMFSSAYQGESKNYTEGLRLLSHVIGFFQARQVFNSRNTPGFPPAVQKLTFNMFNVDLGNLSNLWGALGAKYMPSVIYQVRMVTIFEDMLSDEIGDIRGINTST